MKRLENSRREFLSNAGMIAGAALTGGKVASISNLLPGIASGIEVVSPDKAADYTLRIVAAALEIGKKQIVSAVTYNGQFSRTAAAI